VSAAGPQWISLASAAGILGTTAPALRKSLEARAAPSADGFIEAELNGTRGRKQGRTWRVLLAPSGGTPARDDQTKPHTSDAVQGPLRGDALSGEHSVEKIGRTKRIESASSPRRGRSFVVTMADATAAAGRREVTAKIVETDTGPDQADRLGLRLADGVLDLVAEILVEIVREDEGRDGEATIVGGGGTGS
jgi:hypothetical protein